MPTQAEVGGMLSPALNAEDQDRQEPPEARRGEAWVDSPAHTSSQTSSLQNWEERARCCVNRPPGVWPRLPAASGSYSGAPPSGSFEVIWNPAERSHQVLGTPGGHP